LRLIRSIYSAKSDKEQRTLELSGLFFFTQSHLFPLI
jgi:hypothetical protein